MHRVLSGALRLENFSLAIADLPERLHGTKLVHLSDFHYDGLRLSDKMLHEAIEASNRAEPDIIVLTGDYVTTDPAPVRDLARFLQRLNPRVGIYACMGNHDLIYSHSRAEITDALTRAGIQVLWNEVTYPWGDGLAIVGLADFWSGEFKPSRALKYVDPDTPRVVLSHNPDTAKPLKRWRVDLQLSGHTHGGQIRIPGIGPAASCLKPLRRITPKSIRRFIPYMSACNRVVEHWEWAAGLHRVGDNLMYVNRGLGTYFPGRLFCPPEVTVMTLKATDRKPLDPDGWGSTIGAGSVEGRGYGDE